jgi:hypothetical protein
MSKTNVQIYLPKDIQCKKSQRSLLVGTKQFYVINSVVRLFYMAAGVYLVLRRTVVL